MNVNHDDKVFKATLEKKFVKRNQNSLLCRNNNISNDIVNDFQY